MLILFYWLWKTSGLGGAPLWFGIGILFSLAGDTLLMISLERMFLPGLVAFLLAHIAYLIGFNIPVPGLSAWGFFFAIVIGLGGARVTRRIIAPLAAKGQARMRAPLIVYSGVISLMLLSAMLKLTDPAWNANAATLVSAGAFLFYLSDILLAWHKFVSPIQNGRVYNIGAYHLGQIALIAGVVAQFGN
jgi:uncharacterized membrane protein YhhN